MTFFTINAYDNNYFINKEPFNEIEKICFNSWKEKVEVKVFDFNSEEVKCCAEKYNEIYTKALEQRKECCFADIVRLYILSIYPEHFYFDCDIYLKEKPTILSNNFQLALGRSFQLMYNGNDLETAKKLLSFYNNEILRDKQVVNGKRFCSMPNNNNFIHLCGFDKEPNGAYSAIINNLKELDNILKLYKNKKTNKHLNLFFTDEKVLRQCFFFDMNNKIFFKSLKNIKYQKEIINNIKKHYLYLGE